MVIKIRMDSSQDVIFISESVKPSKNKTRRQRRQRRMYKKALKNAKKAKNESPETQPIKSPEKQPIKSPEKQPIKSPEKQPMKLSKKRPKTSFMSANIVDDSVFETAIVIDESNLFTIDETGADTELDSISSISINDEDEKTVVPQNDDKSQFISLDTIDQTGADTELDSISSISIINSDDFEITVIPQNDNKSHVISLDSDSEPEIFEINDSVIVLSDTEDLSKETNNRKRKRKNKNFESWVENNTDKPFIIEKKPKIELPQCTANSYIPYPSKEKKTGLRPIVIDGCNVAFGHGKSQFSSLGLKICVDYFKRRGHTVKVFVPQYRRRHNATRDSHLLDDMEKEGILVYTPSRNVNGRWVVSYDDRYIVEYAHTQGGVIVTRDNYRDLTDEHPEWMSTIFSRLLMYTWVDDMIMFPEDPLGRGGPTLNQFLHF